MENIKEYWFLINSIALPFLSFIVGKYINRIKKTEEEQNAMQDGIFGLTQSVLLDRCERYRAQCWCSYEAKQALQNLYDAYHRMGGNSFITAMVESCMKLPDVDPNKSMKTDSSRVNL